MIKQYLVYVYIGMRYTEYNRQKPSINNALCVIYMRIYMMFMIHIQKYDEYVLRYGQYFFNFGINQKVLYTKKSGIEQGTM